MANMQAKIGQQWKQWQAASPLHSPSVTTLTYHDGEQHLSDHIGRIEVPEAHSGKGDTGPIDALMKVPGCFRSIRERGLQ